MDETLNRNFVGIIEDQFLQNLKNAGKQFIYEHEAEYLSGNEYQMLQRLRDHINELVYFDIDPDVIGNMAHELLTEFKQLNKIGVRHD